MNAEIKGHECIDGVRQIIQLFFNLHSDIDVYSSFSDENGISTAFARVTAGGKTAEGEARGENVRTKREISDLVKKSVFKACRSISEVAAPWGISTGIRPAKTASCLRRSRASGN